MHSNLATRRASRPRAAVRRVLVEFDVPKEILKALQGEKRLVRRIREGFVMELLRRELVSTGRAQEMLGLDYASFLALQNAHDIPTFRFEPEDLAAALEVARSLRPKTRGA